MKGPPSYRCSTCAINWPLADEFRTCPNCGGKTSAMRLLSADRTLDWDEAIEALEDNHAPASTGKRIPTARELAELRAWLDYWPFASGPDDPRLG